MRIFKYITSALCIISAILCLGVPYLSSCMQSYYKAQIDIYSYNTQELLDKKKFWANLGESPIMLYIFILCFIILFTVLIIERVRKKKEIQ